VSALRISRAYMSATSDHVHPVAVHCSRKPEDRTSCGGAAERTSISRKFSGTP